MYIHTCQNVTKAIGHKYANNVCLSNSKQLFNASGCNMNLNRL